MVVVLTVLCTNSIYCKLYPSNLWDFNNDLSDMSSSKNLIYGQNYEFTSDRYCKLKSAVYLKQGYLQAPPGVYFSGDFTISLWIWLNSYQSFARLIDFSDGYTTSEVAIYQQDNSSQISAGIYEDNNTCFVGTLSNLSLKQWYYVTFVLNGTNNAFLYVNGNQVGTRSSMSRPESVERSQCYFGKSANPSDSNLDAIIDTITIYQAALEQYQVIMLYNRLNNGI